jgi:N-glycosylase/DNA lyase
MDYTYATQKDGDVEICGLRNFELSQTLDCGQAFRWREISPQEFSGIAHGRRLDIFLSDEKLILKNVSPQEFETTWKNYFDLARDYEKIHALFSRHDNLRAAVEFSPGLRLLRQDAWEVLISFILSQNANIPRIKKMVEVLCESFGEKLPCGGFAFPTPAALASLSAADLAPIKCGYRAAYILDAAKKAKSGEFNPAALQELSSDEILSALLKIHGVGAKVADCVLLYGFGRVECYPTDVWIKRAMNDYFPHGFPTEIKHLSGIAQQFLFHYVRSAR